jgi:enoyl-CoA hydratase/carnithine racemase
VVPKGQARERALALALQAEKQSPSSVAASKQLIQGARHNPLGTLLQTERELFVDLFDTQDQKEGVNAFLEKRAPSWKNA